MKATPIKPWTRRQAQLAARRVRAALAGHPCIRHSLLPTPVQHLETLSRSYGINIFCKRDDLTGFGFGGNKTRKLDFLLADALRQECDTLLAAGATQSNFCRVVAAYGAAAGMEVHLVLGGRQPRRATGNLLLDHLLGAHCHPVASDRWADWESAAQRLSNTLTNQQHRVYRMPIGGSTPCGACGYVEAFAEILDDQARLGLMFDAIVFASSSAGTQAGLVVGSQIAGWPGAIIGMSVAKPAPEQCRDVITLARATARKLGRSFDPAVVRVDDAGRGKGYAIPTPSGTAAIQRFARDEGIFLDAVYTGKAAAGMLEALGDSRLNQCRNVLFIHTGGNVELFA